MYVEDGSRGELVRAFIPDPLPPVPTLPLNRRLQPSLEAAIIAVDGWRRLEPRCSVPRPEWPDSEPWVARNAGNSLMLRRLGVRSLLQECQQRCRGSDLVIDTAQASVAAPSGGQILVISRAFHCRYAGSRELSQTT